MINVNNFSPNVKLIVYPMQNCKGTNQILVNYCVLVLVNYCWNVFHKTSWNLDNTQEKLVRER